MHGLNGASTVFLDARDKGFELSHGNDGKRVFTSQVEGITFAEATKAVYGLYRTPLHERPNSGSTLRRHGFDFRTGSDGLIIAIEIGEVREGKAVEIRVYVSGLSYSKFEEESGSATSNFTTKICLTVGGNVRECLVDASDKAPAKGARRDRGQERNSGKPVGQDRPIDPPVLQSTGWATSSWNH